MLNNVYIFDVDGTLTPARERMTKEFQDYFMEWSKRNIFYLVTGSDLDKMVEQVPKDILENAIGLFSCSGNTYHVDGMEVYNRKFNKPETLMPFLNMVLAHSKYPHRYGNHIEDRGSMVNFSIVGRDCTMEQRKEFFEWDNKHNERERIANILKQKMTGIDATIGGQISIDIYDKGSDKSQVLSVIQEELGDTAVGDYIFFGDRTMEGGNDYPLAELLSHKDRPYGYAYQVDDWKHTKRMLEKLYD